MVGVGPAWCFTWLLTFGLKLPDRKMFLVVCFISLQFNLNVGDVTATNLQSFLNIRDLYVPMFKVELHEPAKKFLTTIGA